MLVRSAVPRVRSCLLALLVCCSVCWAAAGIALASEYKAPTEPFTEPAWGASAEACEPVYHGGGGNIALEYAWESDLWTARLCNNQRSELKALSSRLFWVVDELSAQRKQLEALQKSATETVESLGSSGALFGELKLLHEDLGSGGPTHESLAILHSDLTAEGGLPVAFKGTISAEPDPEATEAVVASIDAGAEATKGALYLLAGEVVALVIGYGIWRTGALNR
jgi:hypothetical protein